MANDDDFEYQIFDEKEDKGFERIIGWIKKGVLGIGVFFGLGYLANKNPEMLEELKEKVSNQTGDKS